MPRSYLTFAYAQKNTAKALGAKLGTALTAGTFPALLGLFALLRQTHD